MVDRLAGQRLDRALRLSIAEGASWALMVGLAETYFVANAVALGASAVELGLVVALPLALGAAGPIGTIGLLSRFRSRRPLTVAAAAAQALVLASVGLVQLQGALTAAGLIAGACAYQIMGQAAGTAWGSWYGDLVPVAERGRWFSGRNRVVYVSTCVGLVIAGLYLQAVENEAATRATSGFAGLFLVAAGFRLVSAALLAASPEPTFAGISTRRQVVRFASTGRGRLAARVLLLGASFHFVVYWSSPYFAPFMLEDLRFTYTDYMLASISVIVAKALFTATWGRVIDQRSSRLVYLISMAGVALVPLPWVWAQGLGGAVAAQVLSGAAWSGYEVGYLAMLLEGSSRKMRPHVFAAQSILNGSMQIAGTMFAALVLLPAMAGYRDIFLASAVARVALVLIAPLVLARTARGARVAWSGVGVRLFGLRAHGGFSLRPVPAPSDETEADDPTVEES